MNSRGNVWATIVGIGIVLGIIVSILTIYQFVTHHTFPFQLRATGQSTPFAQTFQCPSTDQVSSWTNSTVKPVTSESCAFKADGGGQALSGVICTNQDGGTTIEYVPIDKPNTLIIANCDGNPLSGSVYGFTIRFLGGYPAGDANVCSLAQNAPKNLPSNWQVIPQASC
jgi:hypothetical protein